MTRIFNIRFNLGMGMLYLASLQQATACSCGGMPSVASAVNQKTNVVSVRVGQEIPTILVAPALDNTSPSSSSRQDGWKNYEATLLQEISSPYGVRNNNRARPALQVRTAWQSNFCGVNLEANTDYILSGDLTYSYENNQEVMILTVGSCGYQRKQNELDRTERMLLQQEYACNGQGNQFCRSYTCPDGYTQGGAVEGACHYDPFLRHCVATEITVCSV